MEEKILTEEQLRGFIEYLFREERSAATQEKYNRDTIRFAQFLGVRAVTKDAVIEWKKELIKRGYTVRSINSMLAAVNALLSYLGWHECKVKQLRIQRRVYTPEDKELSKKEYRRLLDASRKDEQLNLILQTICSTGIRVSELRYFTVEAVHQGEISVNCKSKTRTILVPGKLRKQLLAYAKRRRITAGVIFRGRNGKALDRSCIWRRMKQLCKAAGVPEGRVFPHNLRKLFARTFYAVEKDIAQLADVLGHSSINTTRIYIMTTGIEHRQKIEGLGLLL